MITLKDVLWLINRDEVWSERVYKNIREKQNGSVNIIPDSVFRVNLRFMSEEETTVFGIPVGHPILIPYYDAAVDGIGPTGDAYTIEVWVNEKYWFPTWEVGK